MNDTKDRIGNAIWCDFVWYGSLHNMRCLDMGDMEFVLKCQICHHIKVMWKERERGERMWCDMSELICESV